MQARPNNYEPFKPHADADDYRDHKKPKLTFPKPLKPKELDRYAVTKDQKPVKHPVRAVPDAVIDHELFILGAAVPPEKGLHRIPVDHDKSGRHHHLTHINKVGMSDEILHVIPVAKRNAEDQHHRNSREDRTGDEVRWKDRGVPPGNLRHREV